MTSSGGGSGDGSGAGGGGGEGSGESQSSGGHSASASGASSGSASRRPSQAELSHQVQEEMGRLGQLVRAQKVMFELPVTANPDEVRLPLPLLLACLRVARCGAARAWCRRRANPTTG